MNAIPFLFQYMSCAYSDKGLYHHNMYEIRYTCTSVLSQETRTFLTKNSNQKSGEKITQNRFAIGYKKYHKGVGINLNEFLFSFEI